MKRVFILPFCLFTFLLSIARAAQDLEQNRLRSVPKFSHFPYTLKAHLSQANGTIQETIQVYYDPLKQRSRVDYNDGVVKTVQRADLDTEYSIVYKTIDVDRIAHRACLQRVATFDEPIALADVLPDLSEYTFSDAHPCEHDYTLHCEKWIYVDDFNPTKTVSHSMVFSRHDSDDVLHAVPLVYSELEYSQANQEYNQKKLLVYDHFRANVSLKDSLFDIYKQYKCQANLGSGPNDRESMGGVNPIAELLPSFNSSVSSAARLDVQFQSFIELHNKSYSGDLETAERKAIFAENKLFVESENRKNVDYKLALNHLADYTPEELARLRGLLPPKEGAATLSDNNRCDLDSGKLNVSFQDLSTDFDWRTKGAISPVKDQSSCSSCWAFGSTGAIESAYFLKNNQMVLLSEQQLIDCSWEYGNVGCDGGLSENAFEYLIAAGGQSLASDYGRYLALDGQCLHFQYPKVALLDSYCILKANDVDGIKTTLVNQGPIEVSINAAMRTFLFYSSGVYSDRNCDNHTDHSVLLVGYGRTDKGRDYWIIKNSWNSLWGEQGFMRISAKHNLCGVTNRGVIPKLQ